MVIRGHRRRSVGTKKCRQKYIPKGKKNTEHRGHTGHENIENMNKGQRKLNYKGKTMKKELCHLLVGNGHLATLTYITQGVSCRKLGTVPCVCQTETRAVDNVLNKTITEQKIS